MNGTRNLGVFAVMALTVIAAYGQEASRHTFVSCAVRNSSHSTSPGTNVYIFDKHGYALRKSDGGLKTVIVTDGIGCQVDLIETGGKSIAHVIARQVGVEPLKFDNDGVLRQEPIERTTIWEADVDMTTRDVAELDQVDTLPGITVTVLINRDQ